METDGKKQRNALTAVERALGALGAGDAEAARRAMGRAVGLDQLGLYDSVERPILEAADELERTGTVPSERWDEIASTLEPGPLRGLVNQLRV